MTPTFRSLPFLLAAVAGAAVASGSGGAAGSVVFQSLDTNRDGFLSRDELRAHARLLNSFDAIDANRDGRISNDELQAWHAAHLRRPGSEGKAFTTLDANGDGQIERTELPNDTRLQAWFDDADTNRDGVVTKGEARAARAAQDAGKTPKVAHATTSPQPPAR
jgi:Ca2+-binding EF-hand superfamily protein